jgi:diguanylate cyclase (GGDEF)-like protein
MTVSDDRVVLGRALQARADEVGTLVDRAFAVELAGEAFATARLGSHLIGHWLATDEVASADDEAVLSGQGERAILENAALGDVAKAYLAWRDATTAVIIEEGQRLRVAAEVVDLACDVVRLSCDGSLVRIVREFDSTRRTLQQRLRQEQASLAHQALHDQLTGLPNRALLTDRLGYAASSMDRKDTGAILLFLDIDNFKAINDRFGHSAGDQILVTVARRLSELVRTSDTVARLGGDEFVVLAVDLDDPEGTARALAERIHQTMLPPVAVGDRQLFTSVSIGIADVDAGGDPEVSLSRADAAMYQAKRRGSARFEFYSEAIGAEKRRRIQLVHDLRTARELGQMVVHYQPLFTVDGQLVGREALLRWNHPELGTVSPFDFIPLLERSGEIVPVGRWVLNQALGHCRKWSDGGGPPLTVCVNVSAHQLHDARFFDDVREALTRSSLGGEALVLEVSESVVVADDAEMAAVMGKVKQLGVRIALDDFGTGYASLLYLKTLPIDRIKVERRVVGGLGVSTEGPTIVATVIELAHKLGLVVVAEGIETEDELRAVRDMGCDEVQGFLLGCPVPASVVAASPSPAPVVAASPAGADGRDHPIGGSRLSRRNMPR